MNMLDLPIEMILGILHQLDGEDLLCCRLLCSGFRKTIDNCTSLQYALKLAQCNYRDGPNDPESNCSPAAVRLTQLQEHIDRWHNLDWTETRIRMPHGHLYEFTAGVYCLATHDSLTALELPSRVRGTEARMWTLRDFGFDLADFSFNPIQDLLVLAELKPIIVDGGSSVSLKRHPVLHFRTLSTNKQHPLAKFPSVECPRPGEAGSFVIRLMGSMVGVLFRESRDPADPTYLQMIDWTTGIANPIAELKTAPNTWCFLSPTIILLPHRDSSSRYCVALCKIDATKEDGLDWVTFFHFPDEAVLNVTRSHVSVFSDPPPLRGDGRAPPGRPFYINEERIVKIEWLVMDHRRRVDWVEIYVPARVLCAYAEHPDPSLIPIFEPPNPHPQFTQFSATYPYMDAVLKAAQNDDAQPHGQNVWYNQQGHRHLAWDAWGPENTRMMWKVGADNEFQCFIFGTRAVSLSNSSKITVRTFGSRLSGWGDMREHQKEATRSEEGDAGGADDDKKATRQWMPGDDPSITVFQQLADAPHREYATTLPHHVARRNIGFTLRGQYSHGVMCDDEHIILVEKTVQSAFDTLIIYSM